MGHSNAPFFDPPGTNHVQEDASVILTDNLLQMLTKLKVPQWQRGKH